MSELQTRPMAVASNYPGRMSSNRLQRRQPPAAFCVSGRTQYDQWRLGVSGIGRFQFTAEPPAASTALPELAISMTKAARIVDGQSLLIVNPTIAESPSDASDPARSLLYFVVGSNMTMPISEALPEWTKASPEDDPAHRPSFSDSTVDDPFMVPSIDKLSATLSEFAKLAPGWDGMDADPIDELVVRRALRVAWQMQAFGSPFTGPAPDGSVLLRWTLNDRAVVEIYIEEEDGEPLGFRRAYTGRAGLRSAGARCQ